MTRRHRIIAAALAALLVTTAAHAGVPLWQRVLRWVSGDTSETPVQTHMMGKHMQMSVRQPPQPGDAARAEEIRAGASDVLQTYRDVADVEAEGYVAFAPTGKMGEEVSLHAPLARRQREARDRSAAPRLDPLQTHSERHAGGRRDVHRTWQVHARGTRLACAVEHWRVASPRSFLRLAEWHSPERLGRPERAFRIRGLDRRRSHVPGSGRLLDSARARLDDAHPPK